MAAGMQLRRRQLWQSMEMPVSIKIVTSAMAIAIVLALPSIGETAQQQQKKKKAKAPPQTTNQQFSVPGSRTRAGTPCVVYTWEGCLGWDPDPFIRAMIDRDRGKDDR